MWLITALLILALVPSITFLQALAIGACVTPTDPILSTSILKGKFADKHIPKALQRIVIAESGLNDGLGYPFLFLPLYLFTAIGHDAHPGDLTAGRAVGMWFYETWAYQIILSSLYGFVCGWVAKELLHWAERRKYVDRESFIVFALALAVSTSSPFPKFLHLGIPPQTPPHASLPIWVTQSLTKGRKQDVHHWHRRSNRQRRRPRLLYRWQCIHMGRLVPRRNSGRHAPTNHRHAPQRRSIRMVWRSLSMG